MSVIRQGNTIINYNNKAPVRVTLTCLSSKGIYFLLQYISETIVVMETRTSTQ